MAEDRELQRKAEPVRPNASFITSNPFRESARNNVTDSINATIEGTTNQRRIGKIGSVPVVKSAFIGASLEGMEPTGIEGRALTQGREFVVIQFQRGMLMLGLPEEFGLTLRELTNLSKGKYKEGDLPTLEKVIKNYETGGTPIRSIYVSRPLDCLQFVNRSITSGGATKVNPSAGVDLRSALETPGNVIISTRELLLSSANSSIIDPSRTAALVNDARPGDVVMFLLRESSITTIGQAKFWEESNEDRIIWLARDGRVINTQGMRDSARPNGFAYHVGHTGVYAGLDSATHRPLVAQSHIQSGVIAREALDTYLTTHGGNYNAVAIVSFDFFANRNEVARR